MSVAIETRSDVLAAISEMESALARMKLSLGEGSVSTKAAKKSKKVHDPDAPKRPANVWIQFTSRVNSILKAAAQEAKDAGNEELLKTFSGPATIAKQFCSFLKEQKSYDDWADNEILEAFNGWERPEVSKSAKAKSESASETGSVTEGSTEKKERKKREPMTEEAKAAMAAKRAATIASKAAAAEPEPEAKPEAVAKPVAKPKMAKKAVTKPTVTYTPEQLYPGEVIMIDGDEYGVNARGDVADGEGEFVGHWDAKSKSLDRDAIKPADWDTICSA
jgi:hypothetical protein